jgi:uncharacterized protein YbaR (Trm112 family)
VKPNHRSAESILMRFFRRLGFNNISWSLRRLHCPVHRDELVLEVGSGGNPYFRSDVLLDAYEDTRERHWVPLVSDRPTVLGFAEHLPFRDMAFDFVIASHVLEHSSKPVRFLGELQRVAKAGYIEVPDAFMERINPYRDHRLEITERNNCLLIRKKAESRVDPELVELYEARVKKVLTQETMRRHPFDFHVRYYWEGKIDFEILNPQVDANWTAPPSRRKNLITPRLRQVIVKLLMKTIRTESIRRRRNIDLALSELLACPSCRSIALSVCDKLITCRSCSQTYPVRKGMPVMYPASNTDIHG